jgi:arsenate reductase
MQVHWGIPDSAAVDGPGAPEAFRQAYDELERRISGFMKLPIESLDRAELEQRLRALADR